MTTGTPARDRALPGEHTSHSPGSLHIVREHEGKLLAVRPPFQPAGGLAALSSIGRRPCIAGAYPGLRDAEV